MITNSLLKRLFGVILILSIILYLPLYHGFTVTSLFRGVLGNLSFSSIVLLLIWVLRYIYKDISLVKMNRAFAILLSILGVILYASTLNFLPIDIYDSGYFPDIYFLFGFCLIEFYLWKYARFYAWLWLLAILAFYLRFEASHNLWDYLFDPLLWLYAIISLFSRTGK